MNEDIRRILDLLDEDLLQGLEGLLVKEEGLKQKDWQGYPDVLMKAEISLRTRGLWEEAGQLIEAVSEQQGDWFGKVQLLRRAMIMYNKIGNDSAHVRCHRTARRLIPKDLPARRRMAIWRPAGSALGYPGAGAAIEALEEIEELSAALEEWSVWECFQLHLARSRIYMGIGSWPEAIAQGRAFAGWVACEGGYYSEALALLAREGELRGSLYSMGALYRAAAHAGMGDVELAKQCLIDFQGKETEDGQALRFLKQRREFDVLRGDKDFLAITRELYT